MNRIDNFEYKITLPYIACFLDTDGTIGMFKCHHIKMFKYKYVYVYIKLYFYNTNKNILGIIQKFLRSGKIYKRPIKDRLAKKETYVLMINKQKDCERILRKVLPYLFIKKTKAEECLNYLMKIKRQKVKHL